MNISGVNGLPQGKSQDNSDAEKMSLEQRKLSLQEEIERVKSDKNLSKEAAEKKEADLRDQIKMIDEKIRELNGKKSPQVKKSGKQDASKEDESKVDESLALPKDIYEKSEPEDKEKGDLVYKVTKEDGKLVVKFNRGQKTDDEEEKKKKEDEQALI